MEKPGMLSPSRRAFPGWPWAKAYSQSCSSVVRNFYGGGSVPQPLALT